jgi:tRNA A37 threonylcarbamoyladenosine modification protein TsaB
MIEIQTMALKKAAPLYGIPLSTLRLMATRGTVKAKKVGRAWYVTPAEMDRVFKGDKSGRI